MADTKDTKTETKPAEEFGPGLPGKKTKLVPHPGVSINGKWWIGKMNLTYDEGQNVDALLAARAEHELRARLGDKQAKKVIDLGLLMGGGSGTQDF